MRMRGLVLVVGFGLAVTGCGHHSTSPATATVSKVASPVSASRYDGGNPVIVRMMGRGKSLTVSATGHGPVYSVSDGDGRLLLTRGSLDDLERGYPELYRQMNWGVAASGQGGAAVEVEKKGEGGLDYLLMDARVD